VPRFPRLQRQADVAPGDGSNRRPATYKGASLPPAGLPRPPGKLLVFWLRLLQGHPAAAHIVTTGLLVALAYVILFLSNHTLSARSDLVLELLVGALAVLIPLSFTLWAVWGQLSVLLRTVGSTPPHNLQLVLQFLRQEVAALEQRLGDLRGRGLCMEAPESGMWVSARCMSVAGGRYMATDTSIPSTYRARYADYLDGHAHFLARTGRRDSVRIVVADEAAIAADQRDNPDDFKWFVNWHATYGVELRQLDRRFGAEVAESSGLDSIMDIALWDGEFALLFIFSEPNSLRLRLAFEGEGDYLRSVRYVGEVRRLSRPFAGLSGAVQQH